MNNIQSFRGRVCVCVCRNTVHCFFDEERENSVYFMLNVFEEEIF